MSKQGWVPLGIGLLAAACALDERSVAEIEDPSGASVAELPAGGSSPSGSGTDRTDRTDRSGDATQVAPPASSAGGDVPVVPGTLPVQGTAPAIPEGTVGLAVTVAFAGDGLGRVTLLVPGLAEQVCESDCPWSAPVGTSVKMVASAQPNSVFLGWSLAECGTQAICTFAFDPSVPLRAEFQLAYNVAFVSDEQYTVGQLPQPGAAANQECARLAAAAGLHGQRWVAWLAAEGPTTAVADDITPAGLLQNPGGWVRTDGAPLASTRSALLTDGLRNPLNLTQTRALAPVASWSGVGVTGAVRRNDGTTAQDCNNWTSSAPEAVGGTTNRDSVGFNWTGSSARGCSAVSALNCFGDDPSPEVPLPGRPASARLAFLSTALFSPGGGIEAADQLCQREACSAGLTGSDDCNVDLGTRSTFLSYLHTSLLAAWRRFDRYGPTWYRPDGIAWLPQASNLEQDAAGSLTGMNVHADGTIGEGSNIVWLGRPSGTDNCADWTSSAALGGFGNSEDVGFALTQLTREAIACDSPASVICLQR